MSSLVHRKSPEGGGHAPTYPFRYLSEVSRGLFGAAPSQPSLLTPGDAESERILPSEDGRASHHGQISLLFRGEHTPSMADFFCFKLST